LFAGKSMQSRRSKMSDTISDNKSADATGRMLMIALAILAIIPLVIGLWAAYTGGGFN
jgi:hypothetical protein